MRKRREWQEKEEVMKLQLSLQGKELKTNQRLAALNRETLLDEVLRLTHERNEALVLEYVEIFLFIHGINCRV